MQEIKEAVEQCDPDQRRQIWYMTKLICEFRGDLDRDKKLEKALNSYLEE